MMTLILRNAFVLSVSLLTLESMTINSAFAMDDLNNQSVVQPQKSLKGFDRVREIFSGIFSCLKVTEEVVRKAEDISKKIETNLNEDSVIKINAIEQVAGDQVKDLVEANKKHRIKKAKSNHEKVEKLVAKAEKA